MYQMYTNLTYVLPMYTRVKQLQVLVINKDIRKYFAQKKETRIPYGAGMNQRCRAYIRV